MFLYYGASGPESNMTLFRRSSPGGSTSCTSVGRVHQNAAPGAKSAIYNVIVTTLSSMRYTSVQSVFR